MLANATPNSVVVGVDYDQRAVEYARDYFAASNLSNDGVLLLFTPCGHSRTRFNPEWEHHKIKYSHTVLYKLLRRFFQNVLHTGNGTFPNQKFWDNVINAGSRRYSNVMNPVVCTEPIRI